MARAQVRRVPSLYRVRRVWASRSGSIGAGLFASQVSGYCSPLLLGIFADSYHLESDYAAAVISAESLSLAGFALLAPTILKTGRIGAIFRCGCVLLVLCQLASAAVHDASVLFVLRLVAGIAEGATFAVICATAAANLNTERVFALALLGTNLAAVVFTAILPSVGRYWGGSFELVALALVTAIASAFAWNLDFLVSTSRAASPQASKALQASPTIIAFFLLGAFVVPAALVSVWVFSERVALVLVNPRDMGPVLSSSLLGVLAGSLVASTGSRRVGQLTAIIGGTLLGAVASIAFSIAAGPVSLSGSLFFVGVSEMFLFPYLVGVASRITARLSAVTGAVFLLGVAAGPAMGAVALRAGSYAAIGWLSALCCSFGLSFLAPLTCTVYTRAAHAPDRHDN